MKQPRPWVLAAAAIGLFGFWSNSFIAIGYLLGSDGVPPRFDPVGLTVARFLPAGVMCIAYCLVFRYRESMWTVRNHWARLLVCGGLAVPGYNLTLYYGQRHGVPAPVASLTTALVPLIVMVLAAMFLHEKPTWRRVLGFGVAAVGMAVISLAKKSGLDGSYPVLIGITALAPLCWSVYSVVSKPMMGKTSPIVWSFLATGAGSLLVLPMLPGPACRQWAALDGPGWLALAYLVLPSTVLGFALWTWLLRYLPASTVGFTVFLNPPLTTTSKYLLALLFPATFMFTIQPLEWVGGVLTLAGMSMAVYTGSGKPTPLPDRR